MKFARARSGPSLGSGKLSSESVSALAELFLEELESRRRLSLHTVLAYRRDLESLARTAKGMPAREISAELLRGALAREAALGRHPATAARRLSAWRVFFDYLTENGWAENNPARGLRPPKRPARLPKALTPDETARLLDARRAAGAMGSGMESGAETEADEKGVGGKRDGGILLVRDAAMFELLYSSGLRVGELVALDVDDVDWRSGLARVRRGKGGRGRVAPIGGKALAALEKWRGVRGMWAGLGERGLFVSRRGLRLGARTVQTRLGLRAREAGMPGRVSPHVLRHSCASHFLQSSGDLRATQELLGHSDIAATQIYTRLDFQNLAAVYDRAHPRARKGEGKDSKN